MWQNHQKGEACQSWGRRLLPIQKEKRYNTCTRPYLDYVWPWSPTFNKDEFRTEQLGERSWGERGTGSLPCKRHSMFTRANLKAETRRRFTINTWRGPTQETRDGSKDLYELNDDIDPRWVHTGHKPSQDHRYLSAETRRVCWAAISQRAPVPLALPASETENLISFWKGYNKGWLQKEKLDMKLEVPVQRSCA